MAIHKLKITIQFPASESEVEFEVEFQGDDQKTEHIDASPKRIADLKPGDEIRVKVQVSHVGEILDVPPLDQWKSKGPDVPPTPPPAAPPRPMSDPLDAPPPRPPYT